MATASRWRAARLLHHRYQPTRSSFTYPAPRKLSDIMKVPLVKTCPAEQVKEMWKEYHKDRHDAIAETIPASQFRILKDRAKPCRLFLHPIFREGGYMTMISQFQDMCFLYTYLEDYRANPNTAKPWMSLTLYDEFTQDKALGLLRGDVGYQLSQEEGMYLLRQTLDYYTHSDKYKTVWQFNHEPKAFSFQKYIASCPRPEKKR